MPTDGRMDFLDDDTIENGAQPRRGGSGGVGSGAQRNGSSIGNSGGEGQGKIVATGMIDKEGYMVKLAGFIFKTWEPRFFRLAGSFLAYYKTKFDADSNADEPRCTFDLRHSRVFRAAEGKVESPTAYCMELEVKDIAENSSTSYLMCLSSLREMEEWITAIQAAIDAANPAIGVLRGSQDEREQKKRNQAGDQNNDGNRSRKQDVPGSSTPKLGRKTSLKKQDPSEVLKLLHPYPDELRAETHHLLSRCDMVLYIEDRGVRKERHVILLTSVLLLTKKMSNGRLKMKTLMLLPLSPRVDAPHDSPLEISIVTRTCARAFTLFAPTEMLRDEWVRDIREAISTCTSSPYSSSPLRQISFSSHPSSHTDYIGVDDL
eukprot:TRINITY_DN5995_c0_g1_i1.p1 TRINITY_DN5995_c0_g1~~TRINITY_DN5995_c0_g1_i1.p1  ORF type:complete len:375 (-),score=86.45 TRINITY_DN5995_c0_g1_i1:109-1233(-)